ncbi:MAG: SGNH/GDSL hydrolase family protein, partial [Ruminiclostridium sp.]|nr:SGNH/GDSL hydrolase family protein [Ruminiclostridium sp.]
EPVVSETDVYDDTTKETIGTYTIYSDTYKDFTLPGKYKEFISKCVFVGDSICSGLKAYDILPADLVIAVGNVAARNIFEDWVQFSVHGSKMSLIPALVDLDPEYIVFSMGMNDVNITSEKGFCDNYKKILSETEALLPDAKLIVLSITPITYGESGKLFTDPENIDSFNVALKDYLDSTEKWTYVDVEHEMKNTNNMLKDNYLGSPDGVHLTPDAYYAILYQLGERMVDGMIYNFDGTFSKEGEPDTPEETTAKTEQTTAKTSASSKTTSSTKKPKTEDNGSEVPLSGTLELTDDD